MSKSLKKHLKNFFVPHHENGFHPHIFHRKRILFYALSLFVIKTFMVGMLLFVPMDVYSSPAVYDDEKAKIIDLINQERESANLVKVDTDEKLDKSAELKVNDMVEGQYFSHDGPNGENLKYYIDAVDYDYSVAGENLAVGFYDAKDVVEAWINSPTHYANIVEERYVDTGLSIMSGEYKGRQTFYIANHFGKPGGDKVFVSVDSNVAEVLSANIEKPGFVAKAKYHLAKSTSFKPLKQIVAASDTLNLFFLVLFTVSFMLNLLIEVRTQHIHVIRDSGMLVLSVVVFYLV